MIEDVTMLLSWGTRIIKAIEATDDIKKKMRTRLKAYNSMVELLLQSESPHKFKSELQTLHEIYDEIEALHAKHTAGPMDPKWVKFVKKVNRGSQHTSIEKDMDTIDVKAHEVFSFFAAKSSVDNGQAIRHIWQDLRSSMDNGEAIRQVSQDVKVGREGITAVGRKLSIAGGFIGALLVVFAAVMIAVYTRLDGVVPPSLQHMAKVPTGALPLPRSYVERPGVQEAAEGLINSEEPRTPYTIFGMGGGGKTIMASAVVRESIVREHFRGGIFWVTVGRGAKNSLLPLLQGLAREMGAAPTDAPHGVPHILDSLEEVKRHLTIVASSGTSPRLVVLDDVWEREVVDVLLPMGLKLLVTTRDRSAVGVPGVWLELGDMVEEEALELLLKTSMTVGHPEDSVRAKMIKVVDLCGHLPLVLAIAGSMSVVKGKGLSAEAWEELIKAFKNVAKKMRLRGEQSSSIKVVLETSFDSLSMRRQEESLKMAVLAAGAVAPVEMLLNLWEIEDAEGTREEADGLVSKCLLSAVGGGYRIHDLVLEFMKIGIRADEELVGKATALQARYLGRVDVLKSYQNPEHGAGNQGLFLLDALWRSVETLSGDFELEIASYRASLTELESRNAVEVASSYSAVGFLFSIQGKYAEGEPLYARCQAIYEKLLGPEHPRLATTLNNRAAMLKAQGKYNQAESLYDRALAIREKALGPDHPDVASSLNSRAGLLQTRGKYAEAELLYERATEIWENALGPDHPSVATVLNNRAMLLDNHGKRAEADALYLRAIEIGEKTLGPNHPDLAYRLNNRAVLLRAQGRYAEAHPLSLRAIEIGEKTMGPDHPELARWLTNLAGLLEDQGKYAEAESLYRRSQAIREKTLGPEHPDLAQSLNNLAVLLESQSKFSEAEPLWKKTQEIIEKSLGRDHPDVAVVLNNRAWLLTRQGKLDEAVEMKRKGLAIEETVLPADHPQVASSLYNLAGLLERQGKFVEAEPLCKRSQAIREKLFGPEHPDVAQSLDSRARLLKKEGKFAEAQPLFERAVAIREGALGVDHPDTITARALMADLYQESGLLDKASPLMEEVVSARERVLGYDHPDVASALNNQATLLHEQGKYAEAEPIFERCQAIEEKVLGPEHPRVATTLNNRAALLKSQGKFAEADSLFLRAIEIGEKTLGPDDPDIARLLNNRAMLLSEQENNVEALALLKRAVSIHSKNHGENSPDAVGTRKNLEDVRKKAHVKVAAALLKPFMNKGLKQRPATAAGHSKHDEQDGDKAPMRKVRQV